ncbi:MAG TPA: histidine--tRNA ligase [Kiritimatiellia bacterium]|nr:histidine--tRNA ligase [Kiritimatiellia bacterium]
MASEELQPLQGMADLGPPEVARWQNLEAEARRLLSLYGFSEIRTPVLERSELFVRSLGGETDVVQKEMYLFEDRGGRSVALRPEGTAGVMRHVASRGQDAQDARLYYIGPMFRCERPQAGRRRQFHQLGVEAIGVPNPAADAEVIALHAHLLKSWGLEQCRIQINTRGLPGDRAVVQQRMRELLEPHRAALCPDCQRRLDTNVLRTLDCKNPACQAIVTSLPPLTSFMSDEARVYLDEVLRLLQLLEIPVDVRPGLVRGLDYYLHTVWEITHPALGAQDAIAGGGRYQLTLGGRSVEGVGFAIGLERAIAAIAHERPLVEPERLPLVWVVAQGDPAVEDGIRLVQSLRWRGVPCQMALDRRSMKAQFRAADRARASHVVIRGEAEREKGVFLLKDLATGVQEELDMPALMVRLNPIQLAAGRS